MSGGPRSPVWGPRANTGPGSRVDRLLMGRPIGEGPEVHVGVMAVVVVVVVFVGVPAVLMESVFHRGPRGRAPGPR